MAMLLTGFGSIIGHELGKLAVEHSPLIKQVAQSTAVEVAKKSFDLVLDRNPNFASFLGHFGIHKFGGGQHKTFANRGGHRRIGRH
jgi:hypothetical protein